jgi:hypothetical protein
VVFLRVVEGGEEDVVADNVVVIGVGDDGVGALLEFDNLGIR